MNAVAVFDIQDKAAFHDSLQVRCPRCTGRFRSITEDAQRFVCESCDFVMSNHDGIWNALPPERLAHYEAFIQDYESIRSAEGRGSDDSGYYLRLPFAIATDPNLDQWKIRARTYRAICSHIFSGRPQHSISRVLDIGAGNGWLSYRLSQMGFRAVAVDLLTNQWDGLGAARYYDHSNRQMFCRVRAEARSLPFCDEQFDIAIFNASFHYAEDYKQVVHEALRCLQVGGMLIVADSPWYSCEESGQQMLAERRQHFTRTFGTPSDSLRSGEFLTNTRLDEIAQAFQLSWRQITPFYGLRWALRPWMARLRNRREPSTFRIYYAAKPA